MNLTGTAQSVLILLQAVLAVVGALYAVATLIGKLSPASRFGQACRRFAADLQPVEKKLEETEKTLEGVVKTTGSEPTPPAPPAPGA